MALTDPPSGQNFLSLRTPSAKPTALQAHALQVLTCTFSLLSIPVSDTNPTPTIPSQFVPIPPNVNQLLQQLGLPEPYGQIAVQNVPQNQNQLLPALREMPLRPLLAPLILLLFRTLLLLYFVAPARKPIFAILILAWMLYEIWRPIRNVLMQGLQRAAPDGQQQQNAPAGQPAPNAPGDAPRPPQNAPGILIPNPLDQQASEVLDLVANQNIPAEERILNDVDGGNLPEPTLGHKVFTLVGLLVSTLHPAIWNRRRIVLGRREGRIRTEANMRNGSDTEGEDATRVQIRTELGTQHLRRPRWVREYIERVVVGDWVDDSD